MLRKFTLIWLLLCLVGSTMLYAGNIAFSSSTATATTVSAAQPYQPSNRCMTYTGITTHTLEIDSSDTDARDQASGILYTLNNCAQYQKVIAWVTCSSQDDSLMNLTKTDTTRAYFQTSYDGSNWLELRPTTSDTVLNGTTVTAVSFASSDSTSSTQRLGNFFRIGIYYDVALDGGAAGVPDGTEYTSTYKYGIVAIRHSD